MNTPDAPRLAAACRSVAGRAACIALLLLSVVPAQRAPAATFPDLYTVTVTVDPSMTGSQAEVRAEIVRAAMGRLLTRVTGRRDAAFDPGLAPLLDDAASYVSSYAPLLDRERVEVGFNATNVRRSLNELDWPIWGAERPLTLVWVAVDGGLGERTILGATDAAVDRSAEMDALIEEIRDELFATADERGLPLAFPLLDLEDMIAVSFADVWGGFGDRIEEASRRYQADAILVGRAWAGDFGTEVQWTLLRDRERHFVNGTSPRAGLDWAADHYAGEQSTIGDVRSTRIVILGIDSFGDYGRVMRYLESASLLQTVDVEAFEDGVLRLSVIARGDAGVLRRVLSLGGVLRPSSAPAPSPVDALVFQVDRLGAGG